MSIYCPCLLYVMFMLSFIFVIVFELFEWKRICSGFFFSFLFWFISVLPLNFQLSRGEGWDPIKRFNPATYVCLSQASTWMFDVICSVPFMIKIGGERRFFALLILLEFYESRVTNHWLEKWKNYRGNSLWNMTK